MAVTTRTGGFIKRRDWSRQYPSLLAIGAAVVLAAFALPSSLVLPQASPSQTLEYAPVPPNGQAPPGGNVSALGLGTSGTLGSNDVGGAGLGPPPGDTGRSPSDKQCVGTPPRQTEDPLAPPCVPFFAGNNGGSTYQGVTGQQITVLFYTDEGWSYQACGSTPPAGYIDIGAGQQDGTCVGRNLAVWQHYFNDRFQTYNRHVHFWLYYSTTTTADGRRVDAEDNYQRLHPFAVIAPPPSFAAEGYEDAYQDVMNKKGVFYFTAQDFEPNSLYQSYAPLLWGYAPSADEQAHSWATYVCTRIKPYQSSFAGPTLNSRQRVYGAIETSDASKPLLQQFEALALQDVKNECGVNPIDYGRYPVDGYFLYTGAQSQSYSRYAAPQMAQFLQDQVTTILWPGGYEAQYSKAASQLGYYPEWVTAGDGVTDGWEPSISQDPSVWSHDIVVTPQPRVDNPNGSSICVQAYQSVNSAAPAGDLMYACFWYPAIFQMFVGIQVSGPHLTAGTMNDGYHAIPAHPSSDPEVPACFYDPSDYTCVKDATAMYWDSVKSNQYDNGGVNGCYRMPQNGARYLTGKWPAGDALQGRNGSDPCNGFSGHALAYADTPGTG